MLDFNSSGQPDRQIAGFCIEEIIFHQATETVYSNRQEGNRGTWAIQLDIDECIEQSLIWTWSVHQDSDCQLCAHLARGRGVNHLYDCLLRKTRARIPQSRNFPLMSQW